MTQIRTEQDTNTSGFNDPVENEWIELIEVSECDTDSLIWIRNKDETRKDLRIRAFIINDNIEFYLHNGWVKFQIAVEFNDYEQKTEKLEVREELAIGLKKTVTYTCSDGIEFHDLDEANKHQSIVLKVFNLMKNQNIEGGKDAFDAVFKLVISGLIN